MSEEVMDGMNHKVGNVLNGMNYGRNLIKNKVGGNMLIFGLFCLICCLIMYPSVAVFLGIFIVVAIFAIWIIGFYSARKNGLYENLGKKKPKWYEIWKLP